MKRRSAYSIGLVVSLRPCLNVPLSLSSCPKESPDWATILGNDAFSLMRLVSRERPPSQDLIIMISDSWMSGIIEKRNVNVNHQGPHAKPRRGCFQAKESPQSSPRDPTTQTLPYPDKHPPVGCSSPGNGYGLNKLPKSGRQLTTPVCCSHLKGVNVEKVRNVRGGRT